MTFRNLLAAIALFGVIGGTALPAAALAGREDAVSAADLDGDKRLDGKEMKTLKKSHPKMYDNLMNFCDAAKEHPKKSGVDLPADPSKKQTQCKKKHVARPYLKAWIEKGDNDDGMGGVKPDGPPRADDGGTREQTGH